MQLFAKDFRERAWSKLTGKWSAMVLIALIVVGIGMGCAALAYVGIGAIATIVVGGPLSLGLSKCYLKVARQQGTPEVGETFDGFKNFVNALVLQLINGLFVALWSLLFVIPGIVMSYAYSMSFFILADNPNMRPDDARKLSIKMMEGNKWRLFCLDLSFIGWILLCALTLGILSLWVTPYQGVARAEFYEQLLCEQGRVAVYQSNVGGPYAPPTGRPTGQPSGQPVNLYGYSKEQYGAHQAQSDDPEIQKNGGTTDGQRGNPNDAPNDPPDDPLNADDL